MVEINLLDNYPKRNRDFEARIKEKTKNVIKDARKFGWEYFDKKGVCYGGYIYDGRWVNVVDRFIKYYGLKKGDKVLDIGCAKGYMLYDFLSKGIYIRGLDISEYALKCAPPEVSKFLDLGNVKDLSIYKDKEFDLTICINTIHNLVEEECRQAVREIQRVSKNAFITVDSYRDKKEKKEMKIWNITGKTVLSTDDWKKLFKEEGYNGDYYWFIP